MRDPFRAFSLFSRILLILEQSRQEHYTLVYIQQRPILGMEHSQHYKSTCWCPSWSRMHPPVEYGDPGLLTLEAKRWIRQNKCAGAQLLGHWWGSRVGEETSRWGWLSEDGKHFNTASRERSGMQSRRGGTVERECGRFVLPDERLSFESSPVFPRPVFFISVYPSIRSQQIVIRGAVTKWMKAAPWL